MSRDVYEDVHEIIVSQTTKIAEIVTTQRNDLPIHFCDQPIKQFLDILERTRRSHDRAVQIISEPDVESGTYCLYLRNFEMGRNRFSVAPDSRAGKYLLLGHRTFNDLDFQQLLCTHGSAAWNLIGVQNLWSLADKYPKYESVDEKMSLIFLGLENWKKYVAALIKNAAAIIMNLDSFSEGVVWEIGQIKKHGRQGKTIVVSTQRVRDLGRKSAKAAPSTDTNGELSVPGISEVFAAELVDFQDVFEAMTSASLTELCAVTRTWIYNAREKRLKYSYRTREQPRDSSIARSE